MMKKIFNWQLMLGVGLIAASVLAYLIEYVIYHDSRTIFTYLLSDLAFIPLQVLIVTIIIHELLNRRDREARMNKLNMVIGAFFSEVGTVLLTEISDADPNIGKIRDELLIKNSWTDAEFKCVSARLRSYNYSVDINKLDLFAFKGLLVGKRDFLLRLLENPNLLEHEAFTDLLWAVFHLTEELANRKSVEGLPESDIKHLIVDTKRVYESLAQQWLNYMEHLKKSYPHLFALGMRTNPFDETASVIVRS